MREKRLGHIVQEEYVQGCQKKSQHKNNMPNSDPLNILLITGINAS